MFPLARTKRIRLVLAFIILETSTCTPYFDAMRNACPFTDFCTVPSLRQYNTTGEHSPCCTKCSCEADCWVWDTCCPDVVHEKPVDLQKANCAGMRLNQKTNTQVFTKYRVLDFCPRDYGDKQIIDKCKGKFTDTFGLLDIVAVSDINHGTYKNKYCALCHGVTEFVSWNLKMDNCPSNLSLIGTAFLHTIMENCLLQSVPPSSTDSELMLCGNSLLKTCPESSLSNPEIIQGCHEGPYAPYLLSGHLKMVYKNVLCRLCTTDHYTQDNLCPSEWYDPSKGGFAVFSILLDLTVSQNIEASTASRCTETEIFDNVQQKCIERFCPPFSIASIEACVQIGRITDSLLNINLLFTPTEQVYISGNIQRHDDEQARRDLLSFVQMIDLKSTSCTVRAFKMGVMRDRNSYELLLVFVKFYVLINQNCQLSDVADIVRKQLSRYRYTTLIINYVPVRLVGKIDFYRGADEFGWFTFNYSRIMLEQMTSWQRYPLAKEDDFHPDFFICPYLKLDIDRYNVINTEVHGVRGDNNLTELNRFTRLADDFYMLDDYTIAVCVDTYFKLHMNNGGHSPRTEFTLMFTAVLLGLLHGSE